MNTETAEQIVIDVHDAEWGCDDCGSANDALRHVLDILRHPSAPPVPGSFPYQPEDDEPEVAAAFLHVLAAARPDLAG